MHPSALPGYIKLLSRVSRTPNFKETLNDRRCSSFLLVLMKMFWVVFCSFWSLSSSAKSSCVATGVLA